MKIKAASGIMLTLILISMLTLAFNIQPIRASGTIHVRADGSIDPPIVPIQRDGDVYTFTDNIYDSIEVDRDDIVVDGAGYTLQGTGSGTGIYLRGRNNVTIKNIEVKGFNNGIQVSWYSSGNIIQGSNLTDNGRGVYVNLISSNNSISGNNINNNQFDGIMLQESSGNSVSGNNITANNGYGIELWSSSGNTFSGNNITSGGIFFQRSSYNIISGNNINGNGIGLWHSSGNVIYHNNFINAIAYNTESINTWDDGYPSGGNYWSDYEQIYPDANELDNSGIWDTPYFIDEDNPDRYPLMAPYVDITPPTISILSPENKTYTVNDVPLTFTVSELTSWIGYSLDGQANMTITGNTTLSGLSDGSHSLIVYAKDTAGNTGASETLYFTIETQQEEEEEEEMVPFWTQWWFWTTVIAVIAVLAGAVYFLKKRKQTTPTAPPPPPETAVE